MRFQRTILLLLLFALPSPAFSEDSAALCADRASVERVYYNHRLGQKPPVEQALPPATLGKVVRFDLSKEAALRKAYGVEITSAMLKAQVKRIDTSTRAPDLVAEIKTALGNDPCRF